MHYRLTLPLSERLSRTRINALLPLRADPERRAELRDWITWRRAVVWLSAHPKEAASVGIRY